MFAIVNPCTRELAFTFVEISLSALVWKLYIYILYLGQFKAILNQHGIILGPFVDPLGTILGRFWGYLAQFEPILSHLGIILGPFLGYLEQF